MRLPHIVLTLAVVSSGHFGTANWLVPNDTSTSLRISLCHIARGRTPLERLYGQIELNTYVRIYVDRCLDVEWRPSFFSINFLTHCSKKFAMGAIRERRNFICIITCILYNPLFRFAMMWRVKWNNLTHTIRSKAPSTFSIRLTSLFAFRFPIKLANKVFILNLTIA